jgi:hypothetical protein
MSWSLFVSPFTRSVAELEKAITPPSASIHGAALSPSLSPPFLSTLARIVVPVCRSRTKMSWNPFPSPPTRFVAVLANATKRPSAEIVGAVLAPSASPPVVLTLARIVVPI